MKRKSQLAIFYSLIIGLVTACSRELVADQTQKTELIVSAAASMQKVLQDIKIPYQQQHPDTKLTFNFGSSGSLQRQIEQGAPIDIFIAAAPQQMDRLANQQLLLAQTRHNLVKNQMVLVVPKENQSVQEFSDLTHDSIEQIALGEPRSVPAGQYAQEILEHLGITDIVESKAIYGKDVRQVFHYVATGNIDAGIVYRTDARDTEQVRVVETAPEHIHSPVVYPVAIVRNSANLEAAQQLLQFLFSPEAQKIFRQHGFTSLSLRSHTIRDIAKFAQ